MVLMLNQCFITFGKEIEKSCWKFGITVISKLIVQPHSRNKLNFYERSLLTTLVTMLIYILTVPGYVCSSKTLFFTVGVAN